MHKIHFVLQGKGGIGKSLVAVLLAQYLKDAAIPVLCLDTDPINATFSGFKALLVESVRWMEEGMINERVFDGMVEQILAEQASAVVDNGAASFIPLSGYLIDNEIFETIQESKKGVVIHIVIVGGNGQDNTVSDFVNLVGQLPTGVEVVVWLNEHFGPIEANGKDFQEMKAFVAHQSRVTAIIRLPKRKEMTFGQDMSAMLKDRLTFDEAMNGNYGLLAKKRLRIIQRDLYEQLDSCL